MIPQPPDIKNQLSWSVFKSESEGQWTLILPIFYAELFACQEKVIFEKSTGKRISQSGITKTFTFQHLTLQEIERIENFIRTYKEYIVIGCSEGLKGYFTNDLDFCIALDKNYQSLTDRTEIGQLEYEAKWLHQKDPTRSRNATSKLAKHLEISLRRIQNLTSSRTTCISYVPPNPGKDFYLPKLLVTELVKNLGNAWFGLRNSPLVDASLQIHKNSMKDATLQQKIAEWGKIIDNRSIVLSQSIMNKTVFVIDDLYQSGATLWSYAKYLKLHGAHNVIGVACVKAGKDTDNREQ